MSKPPINKQDIKDQLKVYEIFVNNVGKDYNPNKHDFLFLRKKFKELIDLVRVIINDD